MENYFRLSFPLLHWIACSFVSLVAPLKVGIYHSMYVCCPNHLSCTTPTFTSDTTILSNFTIVFMFTTTTTAINQYDGFTFLYRCLGFLWSYMCGISLSWLLVSFLGYTRFLYRILFIYLSKCWDTVKYVYLWLSQSFLPGNVRGWWSWTYSADFNITVLGVIFLLPFVLSCFF